MRRPLCYYGHKALHAICKPVEEISEKIHELVRDMIETMDNLNGIGLAANQIGVLLKVFIIRPVKINEEGKAILGEVEVFINPILSNPAKKMEIYSEGCLSFPGLFLDIERPCSIHIEALNLQGKKISEDVEGFYAREIMHETDHLHGRTFLQRIKDKKKLQDIQPLLKEIKEKNL